MNQVLELARQVELGRIVEHAVATKSTARSTRNSALVGAVIGLVLGLLAALLGSPSRRRSAAIPA